MIHLLTVHWVDPKWIAPQRRGIAAFVAAPCKVHANLQGIDAGFDGYFDSVSREGGSHPQKLNRLAQAVADTAEPEDRIVFLDGDAFPVRPLDSWVDELLAEHPLAAIQRIENAGDIQPHPSFCVTTIGFWKRIGGDWSPASWETSTGRRASDVGGALLATLREQQIRWRPILRSNAVDLHPVLYGLYEGHVYHHGAGFRPPIARVDQEHVPVAENEDYLYRRTQAEAKSIRDIRPRHAWQLARLARDGVRARKLNAYIKAESRRSSEIYEHICADPQFFRRFEAAPEAERLVVPS